MSDFFPNAQRGPQLAGSIGDRHNLADLAPKSAEERYPRDIATGVHAPSATLTAREAFIEKIVPVLLVTVCKPGSASRDAVVSRLTEARKIGSEIFDYQHGLTMEQTPDEITREKERVEQAKRQAEIKKRFAEQETKVRETNRVDRATRDQLAAFKPRNPSTQHGSPAYWIERANLVTELNSTRAAHGLPPLSV